MGSCKLSLVEAAFAGRLQADKDDQFQFNPSDSRAPARYRKSSAITRRASGWLEATMSVLARDVFQGSTSSAIRSFGPQRATSSTSASGTAAIASFLWPPRYNS